MPIGTSARRTAALLVVILLIIGCGEREQRPAGLFESVDPERSRVRFTNALRQTEMLNTYVFRNFYNGGGVAIGDVNNDGKADLFFTGNQVSNKLYLNQGGFRFEDISETAGVSAEGVWSTGVSMADVNGDGWLDIYVCKSGPPGGARRHNELYINNGDSTFTERAAAYGLAVEGLSIHASFFDYDRDGDLDMYLLSNPIRSVDGLRPEPGLRERRQPKGGNTLYRNELISAATPNAPAPDGGHAPRFTDVTAEAGIYSSEIGFGLGVSVGDVNRDGWPDLYVSNDFFERDYLYLNNRDGTFREVLPQAMQAVSLSSMGGDIADINHDGYPDIFVSDMLPGRMERLRSKIGFRSWAEYQSTVEKGYHYQFTRNTLQLNRGHPPQTGGNAPGQGKRPSDVVFSEVGRLAGVDATDWSWGGLFADFDHDGYHDLFVPNGIYRDLLDQDYIAEVSSPDRFRALMQRGEQPIVQMVEGIPSNPIPNRMFAGGPSVRFTDATAAWGLDAPSFSNGSAYGDLDNDGDLDLVVSNVNMAAFVYRNRAAERYPERGWLQVELRGRRPNRQGVGAQVTVWTSGRQWHVEQQPVRGFQSTVDGVLHVGLGSGVSRLDTVVVRWPDGVEGRRWDVAARQRLVLQHPNADS